MLADHKQIDKRTTMRNQNRGAALGRPAMKLLSLRSTNPRPWFLRHLVVRFAWKILGHKCIILGT